MDSRAVFLDFRIRSLRREILFLRREMDAASEIVDIQERLMALLGEELAEAITEKKRLDGNSS